MSKKVAFITGITGQDGSYLTEFLLEKGHIDMIIARNEMRDRVASSLSKFINIPEPVDA